MDTNWPRIGIGVILLKDNKVLLGLRRGSHGAGTWSFPGGHLELCEEVNACARREAFEETGALISVVRQGPATNDIFHSEGIHYVTLFVVADYVSGEIEIQESEKCERWEWFDWNALPQPLFLPVQNLLKTGFDPFTRS
jgi:8-oxo-dGTP diphosphatase